MQQGCCRTARQVRSIAQLPDDQFLRERISRTCLQVSGVACGRRVTASASGGRESGSMRLNQAKVTSEFGSPTAKERAISGRR